MKTKMTPLAKIYVALIMLFLYAPIVVMIFFSFNSSVSTSVFTGFSVRWYSSLLHDEGTIKAVGNTLILAVSSSLIATIMGTAAAVGINSMKSKFVKRATMSVTNIPMMNPEIVTGISMMLLFVFIGSILGASGVLGFWTLFIAHVTFSLPYVILNVLPKLRQTDANLSQAAQDLGCTPVKAFIKVVLPSILPGVVAGLIMAFTLSFDDFIISYFVSGPKFQTLPIRIFSMTKKRVTPDMYALSTIMFIVILVLLVIVNVLQAQGDNKKQRKDGAAK